MKYLSSFLIILIFFLSSCSDDDNPVTSNDDNLQEEAMEFSLKVVECFITQDVQTYTSFLSEKLYLTDLEKPPYESSEIIVSHYLGSYDYSDYSMDQFKSTYDYEIEGYDEYMSQNIQYDPDYYWYPTVEDYLFIGFIPKEGQTPFMNIKTLVFFVTKSSGEWKIKAIYE